VAKVADYRYAGAFGNLIGISDLKRRVDGSARPVADGLTVRCDQIHPATAQVPAADTAHGVTHPDSELLIRGCEV
jgi:hypothetical protein